MATVASDITSAAGLSDEEKRRLEDEQAQRNVALGAPPPTAQVRSPSAPAPMTEPKGSGSFKNLGQFLQANVGASEKFAGGVASGTEKSLETGKQAVTSEGERLVGQARESGRFITPTTVSGDVATAGSAEWKRAQAGLGAQWAAPKYETSGFATASEQLGGAVKTAESTATQEGLTGLAAKTAREQEQQRLSAGESRFGGLLLGKDVAAQEKFKKLREAAGGVKGLAETYIAPEGKIGQAEAAARGQFEASKGQLRQNIQNLYNKIQNEEVAGRLREATALRAKQTEDINNEVARQRNEILNLERQTVDPTLTPEQRNQAKYIAGEKYKALQYALDAQKAITTSAAPTIASVITPEMAARLNALAALSGQATVQAGGYTGPSFDLAELRRIQQAAGGGYVPPAAMGSGRTGGTMGIQEGSQLYKIADPSALAPRTVEQVLTGSQAAPNVQAAAEYTQDRLAGSDENAKRLLRKRLF